MSSKRNDGLVGIPSGEVVVLLADILANRVLETDNVKEGHKSFGVAVNEHRNVVRELARRLSLRSDDEFNDAWCFKVWPAVCARAEDVVRSRARDMARACPWLLRYTP